uniref:TGBp2 n=1 Tax=Arachis pintoi virus TaxID=1921009 RepID=A0A3G1GJT0_9VIRU|nr:TGBp2 [Arachis pintoi virus]
MSFTPPPDYTKVWIAAAVGGSIALISLIAVQDRTPHVGDNIHHLPHGGSYQDGNKRVLYQGPSHRGANKPSWAPAAAVLLLSVAILVSEFSKRRRRVHRCVTCTAH